jgi:hypothetical protein
MDPKHLTSSHRSCPSRVPRPPVYPTFDLSPNSCSPSCTTLAVFRTLGVTHKLSNPPDLLRNTRMGIPNDIPWAKQALEIFSIRDTSSSVWANKLSSCGIENEFEWVDGVVWLIYQMDHETMVNRSKFSHLRCLKRKTIMGHDGVEGMKVKVAELKGGGDRWVRSGARPLHTMSVAYERSAFIGYYVERPTFCVIRSL